MPIEITPLTPHIGARLTGIDVRRPLTAAEVEAIDSGMNRHAVLVLPGQNISDEQQLDFTQDVVDWRTRMSEVSSPSSRTSSAGRPAKASLGAFTQE